MRFTISQPEAARLSFELVASLCHDGPEQLVNVDNFSGLVTLLDDFATAAGLLTEGHQQQGRRSRPLTTSKYVIIGIGHLFVNISQFTTSRSWQKSS
jgi:golgi-specific brefeldin A-resistance guanine nucleotide exchange factor 1